jgi:hypothetical protein
MSDNALPPLDSQPDSALDPEPVAVDSETLELLSLVLSRANYETQGAAAGDVQVVLGENLDNVVVATAAMTVTDLVRAEPLLSSFLVDRLGNANAEGKRWDGYVVLLTAQEAGMDNSQPLFGVTYNLRHVRRLVKVGVEPTMAGVARALGTLLPLTLSAVADTTSDPLSALEQRLLADGVDPTSVRSAIERFRVDHSMGLMTDEDSASREAESISEEGIDD